MIVGGRDTCSYYCMDTVAAVIVDIVVGAAVVES